MTRFILASVLMATIVFSAIGIAFAVRGAGPSRPGIDRAERSKVDGAGHARGVVQVDLMRQLLAERAAPACPPGGDATPPIATRDHPLLGRRAPAFALRDIGGKTRNLHEGVSAGPVVIVFYLGSTCVACVTHLVECDAAAPRFDALGARVWAISGDAPERSRERMRKFGEIEIPLLADVDRSAATAYGVWTPTIGAKPGEGEAAHGAFIVDCEGIVRWAYVGDRPFTDVDALLHELARLSRETPGLKVDHKL